MPTLRPFDPGRSSEQFQQPFHGEACFGQNLPKRARADSFVVRHNDASIRISAPEDNVAASLAVHDESDRSRTFTSSWPDTSVGSFTWDWW
jgi:hypothetical protein